MLSSQLTVSYLLAFSTAHSVQHSSDLDLLRREPQIANVQSGTTCRDPSVSNAKAAFTAADGNGLILDTLEAIGSPINFPRELVKFITDPALNIDFDCSDFSDGSKCVAPRGADGATANGQICQALGGAADDGITRNVNAGVVVIQSYVNMYNFLRNAHAGVALAADRITKSNALDLILGRLKPRPDTLGEVASILIDLAVAFIPIGGAELITMKLVAKTFTKFLEKEVKKQVKAALRDGADLNKNDLQNLLNDAVKSFQDAVIAQHTQIFRSANDGVGQQNPQFIWLADGLQLGNTISAERLQGNMFDSLTNYILAAFMGSHKARVCDRRSTRTSPPCSGAGDTSTIQGDICHIFGYPPKSVFQDFLNTGLGAQPVDAETLRVNPKVFTIQFPDIINNVIQCGSTNGNAQGRVDMTTFLNDLEGGSTIPKCLFGFPINGC